MTQQDQGNGHHQPARYQTKHRHTRAGYLTAGEAMRRIGLPRSTFYDYVKRGIIPRTQEGYPEAEIDRLAGEFGQNTTSSLSSQSPQACPQASLPEGTIPPSSSHHTERTTMKINPYNWSGILTEENLEEIAQILRDRLTGRTYTKIEINGAYSPDRSQRVIEETELIHKGAIASNQFNETRYISIVDTYNTWSITVGSDCYVTFTGTTVTADWKMPAGHRIRSILVIDPLTEEKGEGA